MLYWWTFAHDCVIIAPEMKLFSTIMQNINPKHFYRDEQDGQDKTFNLEKAIVHEIHENHERNQYNKKNKGLTCLVL